MIDPCDALALHDLAERARRCGRFDLAADLFRHAADVAVTPEGAEVLMEKAVTALAESLSQGGIPAARLGRSARNSAGGPASDSADEQTRSRTATGNFGGDMVSTAT